jgi:3-isopropylmalate dehydrogenase
VKSKPDPQGPDSLLSNREEIDVRTYRIIALPGDGIGPEVMEETLKVLNGALPDSGGSKIEYSEHPLGAAHYKRTGKILPTELIEKCKASDAVLLSAIGLPDIRMPDGTEVQPHQVVGLRKALDLYAAVRPIKLYPGAPSVLKNVGPGIDFIVLRENTEGLFASFGGGSAANDQAVADTMLITRQGTERIVEFAFRLAKRRNGRPLDGRRMVTCVDKANVFRSLAFFRKVFHQVAALHADIAVESCYVDAMSLYMVQAPWNYDVLVMENMFGDILSDLGAGLVGGLGLGPSAEIGESYALFQPSHGSAPEIAGMNVANPLATILSAAMMLDWLGERNEDADVTMAARRIESAVAEIIRVGNVLTSDLGGNATTAQMGDAVLKVIESGRDIHPL